MILASNLTPTACEPNTCTFHNIDVSACQAVLASGWCNWNGGSIESAFLHAQLHAHTESAQQRHRYRSPMTSANGLLILGMFDHWINSTYVRCRERSQNTDNSNDFFFFCRNKNQKNSRNHELRNRFIVVRFSVSVTPGHSNTRFSLFDFLFHFFFALANQLQTGDGCRFEDFKWFVWEDEETKLVLSIHQPNSKWARFKSGGIALNSVTFTIAPSTHSDACLARTHTHIHGVRHWVV